MRITFHNGSISSSDSADIEIVPDYCPRCHHSIHPRGLDIAIGTNEWIEKPFICPREACQHIFIAVYGNRRYGRSPETYALIGTFPQTQRLRSFSETIGALSKDFVGIYEQAEKAEQSSLDLVCGPGYRKALEFLVKDYVKMLYPDAAERIEKMQLGTCISDFVKNERIQAVASRAAWLGNDETHYVRRWEAKDVQDLKSLINLTVHWIEMEEITKSVIKDMPDPKVTKKV